MASKGKITKKRRKHDIGYSMFMGSSKKNRLYQINFKLLKSKVEDIDKLATEVKKIKESI